MALPFGARAAHDGRRPLSQRRKPCRKLARPASSPAASPMTVSTASSTRRRGSQRAHLARVAHPKGLVFGDAQADVRPDRRQSQPPPAGAGGGRPDRTSRRATTTTGRRPSAGSRRRAASAISTISTVLEQVVRDAASAAKARRRRASPSLAPPQAGLSQIFARRLCNAKYSENQVMSQDQQILFTSPSSWTATAAGRRAAACRASAGHRAGVDAVRRVVEAAPALGDHDAHAVCVLVRQLAPPARRGEPH